MNDSELMDTYFFYSAVLALKLLFYIPLFSIVCNGEKIQSAYINDLKYLPSFWVVAALYVTTSPDATTAKTLLRMFGAARSVAAIGLVYRLPKPSKQLAFFMSFAKPCFMGLSVMYVYRSAL